MRVDAIRQLREQVSGPVLTAGDAGYDDARAVHNGVFDRFPRVIVRAEQVSDVVDAVNFAHESGIELSVKGGGHSAPGFGVNDDGLVIDLSLIHGVQVDPQGAGPRWRGHHVGRVQRGHLCVRSGHHGRDRLHYRYRRPYPRRRYRLPGPGARPVDRQLALGPGRYRRRSGENGERTATPGPVLGPPGAVGAISVS